MTSLSDEPAKAYFETTLFNFYYAPDAPGYEVLKAQTHKVFDLVTAGKITPFSSEATIRELLDESNEARRDKMSALIVNYGIQTLDTTPEVRRLGGLYIKEGAIPEGYPTDAEHIAFTSVYGLDYIVSLNFEHISRPWTVERVRRVNNREGYKAIGIYRPGEVLEL